MKLRTGVVALALAGVVLSGCTDPGPTADGTITPPSAGSAGTLTVWLMQGSAPQSVIDEANKRFTKDYPDVTVDVEVQQWSGIQDTLDAALGDSGSAPDVVEVGNSLTARYADAGQLADLTAIARPFDVPGMLPGLQPPGALDGRRYGIPYEGGVRVVIYNKAHFAKAGISSVPRTWAALERAAAKLKAQYSKRKGYSALYFPGADWYAALPFIWETGGELAVQEDGQWRGALDTAKSRAGLAVLKDLVDTYSKAPTDADETGNIKAFRTGDVGMMIDSWWVPGELDSGGLKGDIGVFALPGRKKARTAPVYIGGSDLAVAAASDAKGLAAAWIAIMTGPSLQKVLAKEAGVIPNRASAFAGHKGNTFLLVADDAARVSRFTPVTPRWGSVESARVLPDMLSAILSGEATIDAATSQASQEITELLSPQ